MARVLSLLATACAVAARPVLFGFDVVEYSKLTPGAAGLTGDPSRFSSQLTTNIGGQGNPPHYVNYTFAFSSEDNRKAFEADPWRYAPKYGGF